MLNGWQKKVTLFEQKYSSNKCRFGSNGFTCYFYKTQQSGYEKHWVHNNQKLLHFYDHLDSIFEDLIKFKSAEFLSQK